ncbi:hypothetical protein BDA96_10G116400 [Sorghum bicolor]|uniref:Uncharacterized protein n=1 Tax=Sorghum bicolor TaxID=4558 RepID=A0A921Q0X7_SORBI|nr:hypothetical protein BDA96_10G116400 [Sorghum bicolor]
MDAATGGGAAVVVGGGLDDADAAFFSRRGHRCCGCFWAPPWTSSSSPHARRASGGADEEWWHGVGEGGSGAASGRRRWWRRGVDALMKVREWSELVAGPRWKTFIRRFRFRRGISPRHAGANNGGGGGGKLNYDPLSYALNFDEGHGGGSHGEGGDDDYQAYYRDFSTRFVALAPPPASVRSSMDLGGRDAPPPPLFLHHHPHSPRAPATAAARG